MSSNSSSDLLIDNPAQQGYRLPAEWTRHDATLMIWPSNRATWPGGRLRRVESVFLDIIEVLSRYEPICLLAENSRVRDRINGYFSDRDIDAREIEICIQPVNDVWARDSGPICILKEGDSNSSCLFTDWEYNAWGRKYLPYEDDNRIPAFLASHFGVDRLDLDMVLEGGSVETNGDGVLLTTESVLLNSNRNPNMGKEAIEQQLMDVLGIEKIIWLKRGLAGDDTDGHIDDLARFLNKNTILAMKTDDPADLNHEALMENLEILRSSTDRQGNEFEIVTLPMPETRTEEPTVDGSGEVPASYANFYIGNGVVLVPIFNDPNDREALALLKHYFPRREVVGINCTELVWGQGSIHCITQPLYGIRS